MKKYVFAALIAGFTTNYGYAQHAAHTHGTGELTVAFEQQRLIIELNSPAVNMVGFEHEPQNIDQQLEVEKLIRAAQTPENFFTVPSYCFLDAIDFDSPFSGENDFGREREHHREQGDENREIEGEHHEGHAENHGEGHHEDEDHHDKDGHHEEHHGNKTEGHRDIRLSYEWQCSKNELPRLDVSLFKLYKGFEKIQAQWIVSGKQGATVLTRKNSSLPF